MKQHSILFNNEQFNRLFPFHILIDKHMKIQSFGKSLGKICVLGGKPLFTSLFYINKGKVNILDIDSLTALIGQKIRLKYKEQELISLQGQFEYFPEQEQVLFVGFPSFNSIEELKTKKLTPQDFAIHNPIMAFLEVLKNQMSATKDVKELLLTVDQQKESLKGINEFAANMLNQVTLDDIAWTIIDNTISRFNLEDCIIYLVDEEGEFLIQRAAYGNKQKKEHEIFNPIEIKIGRGIVGKVALTGKPIMIKDTTKVPEYIVDDKIRYSELAVPIIADNKVIGVIDSEHSSKNFFTKQHLIDFTTIANLSAIKIKNAIIHEKQSSIEETVLRKQKMLQGVAMATEELLTNTNLDEALNTSLKILGEAVDVSRAYIFKNTLNTTNGNIIISQSNEWVSKGVSTLAKDEKAQNLTTTIFEEFLPNLYTKEPFETTISQLEGESIIKKTFVLQNIKSILIVPVFHRDRFWGFIGYDDCIRERKWPQDELLLLKSFGNSLSSALEITETTKELKDMALFPLENPNPVVRINLKGEVILINKPGEVIKHAKGIDANKRFEERIYKGLSRRLHTENRMETFEISAGKQFYLATARLSETNEYINIYFSDITKQKEVEKVIVQSNKQLKLQEEKYRNIISNMNLGLLEVDTNGIIQFCNQSFTEISGFDLDEMKGEKASDLIFASLESEVVQGIDMIHPENTTDSFEILTKNKKGEARWWLISLAPNFNDKNRPIGSIGIYLDITKQKRLENELEKALLKSQKASESKELFLANMSHEIRTPLNGIIGMIRELNKEQMSHKQMGYLSSAKKASRHLLSVVNNILEITKIEAGELKLVLEHFSIQELLNDVASILKPQLEHKDVTLNINIDKNVSEAFIGDESLIRQVLINLAGNAIKFTEKGEVVIDCISLRKSTNKQELSFTIRDTGIGMDKKYLTTIFKKFQQEDPSISRKFGGTGLGLFITKNLVDLMGGNLKVQSEKGKGTKVQVCLPLPIGTPSIVAKKEIFVTNKLLSNAKILLVEDHEMNRLVAANTLSLLDVELTESSNGLEAVKLLKEQMFDLILMDIQMPIMSGIEATKIIRNELKIRTPIIALSATAFKSEIDACLRIGMNDYVTKPFEEQDLLRVIVKHYKSPKKRKDNGQANIKQHNDEELTFYDLQNLKEMSRGSTEFVQKMLHLFVETTPQYLEQINTWYIENNIEDLKKVAHKIKPSIDNMGITAIRQDIRNIEHFDETQSQEELHILIEKVNKVLSNVVKQLKEEELT